MSRGASGDFTSSRNQMKLMESEKKRVDQDEERRGCEGRKEGRKERGQK